MKGRYRSGCGHWAERFKNPEPWRRATGEKLQYGTINVKVDAPTKFREDCRVLEHEVPKTHGWNGDYLMEICKIEGIRGYRILGGHGPEILEIACAKLVQKNGQPLKEGDELELEFFEQRPND
jgi:hypothetical protein